MSRTATVRLNRCFGDIARTSGEPLFVSSHTSCPRSRITNLDTFVEAMIHGKPHFRNILTIGRHVRFWRRGYNRGKFRLSQ